MAQQKKFSNLQPPQQPQRQGFQSSNVAGRSSRLQSSPQPGGYLGEVSGISNRPKASFPPQKRMPLPGATYYSTVPYLPEALLAENTDVLNTENDEFIILEPPLP